MILIVPDKFKGTFTSAQAAEMIKDIVLRYAPSKDVVTLPFADGGEGSFDVVRNVIPDSKIIEVKTVDPLMRPINADMLLFENKIFIEMAKCCGLMLLKPEERNPEKTTSFGLGLMIKEAAFMGVDEIIIGIGGSATNDAGEGMLKALNGCLELFDKIKVKVACDVTNPLLGKNGATMVYAPQKGADNEMLVRLEGRMRSFAKKAEGELVAAGKKSRGMKFSTVSGGGAAGGVGAALYGFLNAELVSGWKVFGEMVSLEEKIKAAEMVITGEGRLDKQSLEGKLVYGIAHFCRKYYRSLYVVCGQNKLTKRQMEYAGIRDAGELRSDLGGKIRQWCIPDEVFSAKIRSAGCDEAGRGPLAGPVYAAAVILPPYFYHPLLKDSKKLTASQRETAKKLVEKEALAWSVASVSAAEIDEINILNASILAMHRALDGLKIKPEVILIDGNRFLKYRDIPHKCIVKGDSKVASISAASILAKTYRDNYMKEIAMEYPHYGWDRNMAYPTKEHKDAIKKYGITKYHRKSFNLNGFDDPELF